MCATWARDLTGAGGGSGAISPLPGIGGVPLGSYFALYPAAAPMTARLALLLVALAALPAAAQVHTGSLQRGDATLSSGEFVDRYEVRVRAGDEVTVEMTSSDFDPYLILVEPGGEQVDNDDCTQGDLERACATVRAASAGVVRVSATSYQPGESGRYRVEITTGGGRDSRGAPAAQGWGGRPGDRSGRQATATTLGGDRRFDGDLREGDTTIRSGEFVDAYEVAVEAGRTVTVEMTSRDFDTYLIVTDPDGDQEDNDDCEPGETSRSCVTVTPRRSGTMRVLATSYQPGETGRYAIEVAGGGASAGRPDSPSRPGTATRAAGGGRVETGDLARGDQTIQSGEYADRFTFTGTGGPVVVDLRADGFDPYLIVGLPDGEQIDNDDYEGALDRSLVVVDTQPGASYTAVVTSYRPGETGRYSLAIDDGGAAATSTTTGGRTGAPGVRAESGRLAAGDETLRSGEFVDSYTFHGVPGQRVTIDLTSDDFDTYLVVDPPAGEPVQDDDGGGRTGHSRLSLDLTEAGTYTVLVTSYQPGETGSYDLRMDLSERFGRPTAAASEPARPVRTVGADAPRTPAAPSAGYRPPTRRAGDLTLAQTLSGDLDRSDARLSSGEYTEVHTFDGDAGEPVRIEMTSSDFDTYVIVASPSGEQLDNDDCEPGETSRSCVEFVMPEDGRYRVTATSYRPGETGRYSLRISQTDALVPDPAAYDRIVGVFAGVSDYERPGLPDLRWTAQDAEVVRNAMIEAGMRPEDGILLTDADATVANVRRAFDRLAATTDERTLFVFFFSGHGAQVPVRSAQRSDPDGQDETIELYDDAILDDELDAMLSRLPAGRQLIVLDACFSGGFAKDVITSPGRMGLFSSEEDVVSAVAVKFEAGGYLAHFFADGVAARNADTDSNGAITPLELSQYIHDRYTSDVRGTGRELIVARDTRPEHQRLIVDRGSLGLYDSLFFVP